MKLLDEQFDEHCDFHCGNKVLITELMFIGFNSSVGFSLRHIPHNHNAGLIRKGSDC